METTLQSSHDRLAYILYKLLQGDKSAFEAAPDALADAFNFVDDDVIAELIQETYF